MSGVSPAPGSGGGGASRVPTPASGHHDAQWYRRVATKASAAPTDTLPESRVSDQAAWAAVSHLAAGILLYGGIGWLLGRWLGNQSLFVAGGVLVGVALAMYMLFRRLEPHTPEPETPRPDRVLPESRTEDVVPMVDHTGTTPKETRP
jgi:F0F1-type ATP synthase assembly protein I